MIDNDELMRQRGIYSTLGSERREQIREISKVATAMISAVSVIQTAAQNDAPDWDAINKMVAGITRNNERLASDLAGLRLVVEQRQQVKPLAWLEGGE